MARIKKHGKQFSRVHIGEGKITDYLLNDDHKDGKSKARFFISMGFSRDSPEELADVLSNHPKTAELEKEQTTNFGTKYIFVCNIKTPNGKNVCVVSVWQIGNQATTLQFITAYPDSRLKRSKG